MRKPKPKKEKKQHKRTERTNETANRKSEPRNEAAGGVLRRIFTGSLILWMFGRLNDKIYSSLQNGFFGRKLSAYEQCNEAFETGFVKSYFRPRKRFSGITRKIRATLSEAFESSLFLGKASDLMRGILSTPVKIFGNYLLFFGIYTVLVYFIRLLLPTFTSADESYIMFGIILVLVSFPMHLSYESIASAAGNGKITALIFINAFGFRSEAFEKKSGQTKFKGNIAMLLGLISGLLTFLISPVIIPVIVFVLIFVLLVFNTPEIGVLSSLFFLPFMWFFSAPTTVLAALVLLSFLGYVLKLIRGQRIIKFEIIDLSVLFFGILLFLSGMISAGGSGSYEAAGISCFLLLGYFLVVNLIRTDLWLKRCVFALIGSAVIVSVWGIYQYFFGNLTANWLDASYFTDIAGRVTVFFGNSNMLAFFLSIIMPFSLAAVFMAKSRQQKLLALVSTALILICITFTWSRGAWLAAILGTVIFLLIYSKKTLKFLIGTLCLVPLLPFVLPSSVISRFTSIGNLSESSNLYRFYTWKGTFEAIKDNFWGGIGYGSSAFQKIYPSYSYAGMEASPHSHNLFLEILLGLGIAGLIAFIIVLFLFANQSFEYLKNPAGKSSSLITNAAIASVVSALCLGLFDFIWYNYRIFFLFWVVLAISVASARIGKRELSRDKELYKNEEDNAYVEIKIK